MENLFLAEQTTSPYLIKPSFTGHQTFPFRYTWLKKGFDAVTEDPHVFSSDFATVALGVGKNMVQSIRHWCVVTEIIKTGTLLRGGWVPSELGEFIFGDDGVDPYLDDPATLWLIHWKIATKMNQATAWYWVFNILKKNQFMRDDLKIEMYDWAKLQSKFLRPVSENTLQRDVNVFIRTYCQSRNTADVVEESFDCPLVELNLISEPLDGEGYEIQRGEKVSLPIEVFAATLIAFWVNRFNERDSLTFTDILTAPLSPGCVFKLDEDTLTRYLERLEGLTNRALQYDETADLKQVYRHREVTSMDLLKGYYG
ncbi:DUF4007 family protein [Candidatus Poribacteria bacterium]|nr:DUF4007 family protein [Candidatus Poribacteria bacterium]